MALESASTDLSVALAAPDGSLIGSDAWSSAQRQSAELLPRLLVLLERNGRSLAEATAVAVGIGPGSFTGLRVGLGLAKGLAFARSIPMVGVPSLVAWLESAPAASAALARAGAEEAYLLGRGEASPVVVHRDALPERARSARVLAPGELAAAFDLRAAESPVGAAAAIATTAAARLKRDPAGDDVRGLEPIYLREPRGTGRPEELVAWR